LESNTVKEERNQIPGSSNNENTSPPNDSSRKESIMTFDNIFDNFERFRGNTVFWKQQNGERTKLGVLREKEINGQKKSLFFDYDSTTKIFAKSNETYYVRTEGDDEIVVPYVPIFEIVNDVSTSGGRYRISKMKRNKKSKRKTKRRNH